MLQTRRKCVYKFFRRKSSVTSVIPLTSASKVSGTKPKLDTSNKKSMRNPPGAEWVWVPLIITLFSVYRSLNFGRSRFKTWGGIFTQINFILLQDYIQTNCILKNKDLDDSKT